MTLGIGGPLVLTGFILAVMAGYGAAAELATFSDPCHTWGMSGAGTATLTPDDRCPQRSGSSESRAEAATRLLLINGSLVLAGALMMASARWPRTWLLFTASLVLLLVSIPLLFGGFVVVSIWGLAVSMLGALEFSRTTFERSASHALAIVAALAGFYFLFAMADMGLQGNWAGFVFQSLLAAPLLGAALLALLDRRSRKRSPAAPSS